MYESGAVKLRIGLVLYDLEPGISPGIREEVAAISLGDAPACPFLGEVQRHAVITPALDHLLRCLCLLRTLPSMPAAWPASACPCVKSGPKGGAHGVKW